MISYLLVTKHDVALSWDTIESIFLLPEHDREIIICCPPNKIRDDDRFVWVPDTKCTGSPNAFNTAYKQSHGNYIATMIDDIILPHNYLDILDFMKSDFMKQKKFKISNTMWDGGPGLLTYGHDDVKDGEPKGLWPIDKWHPIDVAQCPYSVLPLPFLERSTIEQHLSNKIFHPAFKNHFIDHWLGFYLSKNETYKPHSWRCPSIRYEMSKNTRKGTEITNDDYDINILSCLAQTFVKDETSYI